MGSTAETSDEVIGAGSTHVPIHDATQSRDNEVLESPYGTIAGTSLIADDVIGIHLYRDHDDDDDTYATNAALLHIEVEYVADKLGEAV